MTYPAGTAIATEPAALTGIGMVDHCGGPPDSSGVEWGDLDGGFFRQDAKTGPKRRSLGPPSRFSHRLLRTTMSWRRSRIRS